MKISSFSISIVFILTLILTCGITSCSKTESINLDENPVILNISLENIESEISTSSSISKTASNNLQPEKVEIPINNELSAYLTLEEDININKSNIKNKLAVRESQPITLGVKYGILVYDGDNLIEGGHKIFTAGSESNTEGFVLFSGRNYTFIGYSINSSELPTVTTPNKLSTAKINSVSGDLLYYKTVKSFGRGINSLKITLRHKFTLITTELKVGNTYGGKIQEIRDANFNNISQSADINLADSVITYSSNKKFELINFNSIPNEGITSLVSNSNLLIAESSSNTVTIAIPSIRVNGKTHSIPATSFNFQKGKKYKLTLTFDVPCTTTSTTGEISVNSDVNLPNPLLGSITIAKPSQGSSLIFNLAKVDNSFNITINNQPIFTRQYLKATRTRNNNNNNWGNWVESTTWTNNVPADMEGQYTDGQLVNSMQFGNAENGNRNNRWGSDWNSEIWSITGTQTSPTVRVSINANGVVTIQGRKTSNDYVLYNLYLRPDFELSTSNSNDRSSSWFQKITSNNGNTETVISKIRFNKNNIVWNAGVTPNTVVIGFEQSSKPTVGEVTTSGVTVFNNVTCN